jgi:HlyD family secretion protein
MDGVILEKLAEDNSFAAPGAPACVIGNTGELEIEANILSDDSYKVKIGYDVEITGKSLGDAVIKGRVSKIAPIAKTMTSNLGVNQKRVQVIIEITDDYSLLKPGYNVDIKIVTASKKDVLAVPDSAVFDNEGTPSVFVIQEDKAVIRQVKKGLEGDKMIEITEGLGKDDIILVKPDNNIKEGIKIKPL